MKAEIAKLAWKVLRPFIEEGLKYLVVMAIERMKKFWEARTRFHAEQAKANADAAATRARSTTDPIERARQEGKEEAWQEIAGYYQRDAESLRFELEQLRESLNKSGSEKLDEIETQGISKLLIENK